ncbi:threonine aldolase family protein [Streptococcus porci]|uniref:threonine aldolase family protein n=1 Tax=Streptococcus porci TaxID=502567 RepID=UPI00041BFA18|nr:aminotransferase class I/II-fold pyridoxal phosphate-dependent enzyme [Streptococcus porci]
MLHFENDYNEGVHPALLQALVETNHINLSGYGTDSYTQSAADKIRKACACPQAQVQFVTGGTQANQLVINSLLTSYEGVLAAETGHIATHEAGAIEFSGHKVLPLPHKEGKISAQDVKKHLEDFYADGNHEHMVFPGMVYISHPTEYGTLYTKAELESLSNICDAYQIPLFMDGARLGYALGAEENELTLPIISKLCHVFYIGGTKMGALAGEAIVFTKQNMPKHFTAIVKQHGALVAKGRLFGVQFDRFFADNLYTEIGRSAIFLAKQLRALLKEKGYRFYLESPTNQQFLIMENRKLEKLGQSVVYSFWEKYDENHTVIRLATSWSTTQEDIDSLAEEL